MKLNSEIAASRTSRSRIGLTLMELVVVLVILAALAAVIVPRISGIAGQSNSASNATIVDDVNRAVGLFEARYNKHPLGWDSLLTSTDAFNTYLHPNIQQTTSTDPMKPTVQIATLDAGQAKSLTSAGIFGLHDMNPTRVSAPSDNSSVWRSMATGAKVVTLVKVPIADGHGSTFIDNALGIDQYKTNSWGNEFIVLGLGGPTSLKGATITEIPLVQSANPAQYYARVFCVYMIPAAGATNIFPATYVGCFLPDGTSLRQNIDKFNSANVTTN